MIVSFYVLTPAIQRLEQFFLIYLGLGGVIGKASRHGLDKKQLSGPGSAVFSTSTSRPATLKAKSMQKPKPKQEGRMEVSTTSSLSEDQVQAVVENSLQRPDFGVGNSVGGPQGRASDRHR